MKTRSITRCALGTVMPILLALLTNPHSVRAEAVAKEKARKAVETWVRRVTADKRANAIIERIEAWPNSDDPTAYVIHFAEGGFCLAGADSLALPVYWYSPSGTYDSGNPGLQAILKEIGDRVQFLRGEEARDGLIVRQHRATLTKRARDWADLADAGSAAAGNSGDETSSGNLLVLPLTTTWGQGSPYNQECPEIPAGSGNHAKVGCVATAASQIMRYWEWPRSYAWSTIMDSHASPYDSGDAEVARLCHDVGVAVDMDYGLGASSALTSKVENALTKEFGYDPDAIYGSRNVEVMVEELRWFRPLQLRGEDADANGHSWVVYGYNLGTSPWQFKMNLGWYGSSSGWYSVDDVPQGYTSGQAHVTQIAPQSAARFVGSNLTLGDGSPSAPFRNLETALALTPDGVTLVFKANSENLFASDTLVINRPCTLKGINAVIK